MIKQVIILLPNNLNNMNNWKEIVETKELKPNEIDVVIYHNPCSDGTASGFVAWKYLTANSDKNVDYYPMAIGSQPPPNLENKNVLICDYSYKKDVLINLMKKVNKILIIDHHESAEKDLRDIDDKYKIFHMGHSGAMLTWFYFFPEVKPPLMIEYVQDRDIWTNKMPFTNAFTAWFYTLPLTFEEYNKYLDDDVLLNMIQTKGLSFEELNTYYIEQSVNYSVPKFCKIKDKYYFVAYVNATICKSDIGNKILDKYPLIDFSAAYSINDGTDDTNFSLRSSDVHVNVAEIAFSMGCGGHRNASGIKVNYVTNTIPGTIYDGKIYNEIKHIYYDILTVNSVRYNVVLFTSPTHKVKLGTYFLQDKYITKNNEPIQVCRDISIKTEKDCPDKTHIALVWSYNPVTNTTKFSVVFDKSITRNVKSTFNDHFGCDVSKGLVYNGFHKTLPIDVTQVIGNIY